MKTFDPTEPYGLKAKAPRKTRKQLEVIDAEIRRIVALKNPRLEELEWLREAELAVAAEIKARHELKVRMAERGWRVIDGGLS